MPRCESTAADDVVAQRSRRRHVSLLRARNAAGASSDAAVATLEALRRNRKAGAACVEAVEAGEENVVRNLADGGRSEEAAVRSLPTAEPALATRERSVAARVASVAGR